MTLNSSSRRQLKKTIYAASTLMLAAAALLFWAPGKGSHAQQEPNRQLVQTGSANAGTGKRIALVIGNGAYATAPPLKNPPNDARDMAATLKMLGFTVASAIDSDQRTMKRLIREFGQQLKGGGQGLFYYAGHGVQMRGRNYLIPANAEIMSETDVEDQGVDLNLVLGLMDEAQNGLNIVILDACRNNPFTRSFRSVGSGLAQVDAPTGTLIAYATSPGRVASDGQGRNGLYTSELLSQMRVPGIGVEEMFKRVRAGVQRQTSGQQVPWESSSLVGNFYFAASNVSGTVTSTNSNVGESRIALDPAAFELTYWETIKNSSNPDDFKSYLDKYPDGQFAALARSRAQPARPAGNPGYGNSNSAEMTYWNAIKDSRSPADFRAYMTKFPNGLFVELANNRIAALESDARETTRAKEAASAEERARNTHRFDVGDRFGAGEGTLTVAPGIVSFEAKNRSEKYDHRNITLQCFEIKRAEAGQSAIMDPHINLFLTPTNGKERRQLMYFTDGVDMAANVVSVINEACKMTSLNK